MTKALRHLVTALLLVASPSYALAKTLVNQWGMSFVEIPAGKFMMGLVDRDEALMEVPEPKASDLKDELPVHQVNISRAFYMGQTEVTQQQWLDIMENRPGPEANWKRADWKQLPVVSISWNMAARFVQEINQLDKQYRYRLPTEAEWEYVARSGSNELRPVAVEDLEQVAWFINNSGDQPKSVAGKQANGFGVYDMLGNVWEWVEDWYAPDTYSSVARTDPVGAPEGVSKVRRGGSFHCPVHLLRPGYRAANRPHARYEVTGFRLVMEKK